MSKKWLLLIIPVLIGITVASIYVINVGSVKNKKPSDIDSNIENTNMNKNSGVNVFSLDGKLSEDKKQIVATLSLKGDISICRYSISLKYDTAALELADYDEQLGVYTPVIFPGKDESGEISDDGFGRVNLEWASAKNIRKESDIAKLIFNIKDKNAKKTNIEVLVKDVNELNDSIVIDADYNKSDLRIDLK